MSTKELSDSDMEYLSKFNTEEEIENEIELLNELLYVIKNRETLINKIKRVHLGGGYYEELEPSIIDKYGLKELCWTSITMGPVCQLIEKILECCKSMRINKHMDISITVYRLYTYRKKMEREYKKIISDFNRDHGTNFNETVGYETQYKDKVILLYDKLVKLL